MRGISYGPVDLLLPDKFVYAEADSIEMVPGRLPFTGPESGCTEAYANVKFVSLSVFAE